LPTRQDRRHSRDFFRGGALRLPTPLLNRTIEVYQKCVDMGLGDTHDVAVLVDVVNSMPRKKN
jgi:hypothetical protein